MPIKLYFNSLQTTPVVPEPKYGSIIVNPLGMKLSKTLLTNSLGNPALILRFTSLFICQRLSNVPLSKGALEKDLFNPSSLENIIKNSLFF